MKAQHFLPYILSCVLVMTTLNPLFVSGQTPLRGPYLGEKRPGTTPVMFAPAFFIEELHSSVVFSPDGTAIYWDLMEDEGGTRFIRYDGNQWTKPAMVPYANRYNVHDPCFSPDGSKLFFTSREAVTGGRRESKENIWVIEKTEKGWSERRPLPAEVNRHGLHWQITVANNGNLYFSDNQDIWCTSPVQGEYTEVKRLGPAINGEHYEGTPFVDPDERFLIFSRFGGDRRYADLFISFKNADGTWGPAKTMGQTINSDMHELCPQVTPDEKYLFFIRNDSNGELRPFWMEASVIESLKGSE